MDHLKDTDKFPDFRRLEWGWCIATYNRHDVLRLSASLALAQTFPPSELVVTDASKDWERGAEAIHEVVELAVASGIPRPRVSYEPASRASLPAQRNESVRRSYADILIMFDDDTLMFPDTAERIMEVYQRDTEQTIQAVTAIHVPSGPRIPDWYPHATSGMPTVEHSEGSPDTSKKRVRKYSWWVAKVRQLLRADDRFVPYDPVRPKYPVPVSLKGLDVVVWNLAAGFHLTCRRTAVLREPFDSRLVGYSPGEDSDMTYRLTRHGPIIANLRAYIHHMQSPGSRFGLRRRTALGAVNALLHHRAHSTDLQYSQREQYKLLYRRLLIELAKDISNGSLTIPRFRGILFAIRNVKAILRCPDEDFEALFQRFQECA